MKYLRQSAVVLLISSFFLVGHSCWSCSLALHDWQPVAHSSLELSSPVLPVTEIDIPVRRLANPVSRIFWLVERKWYNYIHVSLFPLIYKLLANHPDLAEVFVNKDPNLPPWVVRPLPWPLRIPWTLLPKGISVGELAYSQASEKAYPLILGSDRSVLRFALFADKNSNNNCFQLVIAQDGRVRAVNADPKHPWAQEFSSRAYLSLIFYKVPVPGRILNISMYPVNSGVLSLYEDEGLVSRLLNGRLILPRPVAEFDPASNTIPEIPD